MIGHRHLIRVSVRAGGLVVLALFAASASAPQPSAATTAARRCFAANVVGRTKQQAEALLRARGCRPGATLDGRHFLVTKACRPSSDFGRVFAQSARNRALGPKERLIIRVGMRRTAGGRICGEIRPGSGSAPSSADYNGSYSASFTVTTSNTPLATVGQRLTGLTFTAQNGNLAGDITGTVNAAGHSANASANLLGLACPGALTFRLDGKAITVAGRATCAAGTVTVKGTLAGRRTGS
ncbi:MAG: hypothetical protein ABSC51_01585 [Gaiellaceae bacterium]|jgi:hypothetical protein